MVEMTTQIIEAEAGTIIATKTAVAEKVMGTDPRTTIPETTLTKAAEIIKTTQGMILRTITIFTTRVIMQRNSAKSHISEECVILEYFYISSSTNL